MPPVAFCRVALAATLAWIAGIGPARSDHALRVMTFNVWSAEGSAAGREKLAEIIAASGADLVGLQEMGSAAGQEIAQQLGMHFHQQSGGGIQVLSRFPVVSQSATNRGVEVALAPGFNAWLFNAHLAPYPYQPYDLRDGTLPMQEQAVINAANAARGGQLTPYLDELAPVLATEAPVFFTGDYNEPSHLDWTAAAAAATDRSFDFEVEYPTSKRIVDAGLTDSFRTVRPDEVNDRGYTWTPGYPPPNVAGNEVHDRIDLVYHAGAGVTAIHAFTVGPADANPNTDLEIAGYNSDHRAVVIEYELPVCLAGPGDLNGDCTIDAADWNVLLDNQRLDMSRLNPAQAAARGDLNGDFRNDHADFALFKQQYEFANGDGSFASMLTSVPEPSTTSTVMVLLGSAMVWAGPRPGSTARSTWPANSVAAGGRSSVPTARPTHSTSRGSA